MVQAICILIIKSIRYYRGFWLVGANCYWAWMIFQHWLDPSQAVRMLLKYLDLPPDPTNGHLMIVPSYAGFE